MKPLTLGEKVRLIREKHNLTVESLAKLLNMSQGYISQVENNQRQLSKKALKVLSQKLNIGLDFFYRDDIYSLEDYILNEEKRKILENSEFVNYAIPIKKAISGNLTPEEVDEAINFALKMKHKK